MAATTSSKADKPTTKVPKKSSKLLRLEEQRILDREEGEIQEQLPRYSKSDYKHFELALLTSSTSEPSDTADDDDDFDDAVEVDHQYKARSIAVLFEWYNWWHNGNNSDNTRAVHPDRKIYAFYAYRKLNGESRLKKCKFEVKNPLTILIKALLRHEVITIKQATTEEGQQQHRFLSEVYTSASGMPQPMLAAARIYLKNHGCIRGRFRGSVKISLAYKSTPSFRLYTVAAFLQTVLWHRRLASQANKPPPKWFVDAYGNNQPFVHQPGWVCCHDCHDPYCWMYGHITYRPQEQNKENVCTKWSYVGSHRKKIVRLLCAHDPNCVLPLQSTYRTIAEDGSTSTKDRNDKPPSANLLGRLNLLPYTVYTRLNRDFEEVQKDCVGDTQWGRALKYLSGEDEIPTIEGVCKFFTAQIKIRTHAFHRLKSDNILNRAGDDGFPSLTGNIDWVTVPLLPNVGQLGSSLYDVGKRDGDRSQGESVASFLMPQGVPLSRPNDLATTDHEYWTPYFLDAKKDHSVVVYRFQKHRRYPLLLLRLKTNPSKTRTEAAQKDYIDETRAALRALRGDAKEQYALIAIDFNGPYTLRATPNMPDFDREGPNFVDKLEYVVRWCHGVYLQHFAVDPELPCDDPDDDVNVNPLLVLSVHPASSASQRSTPLPSSDTMKPASRRKHKRGSDSTDDAGIEAQNPEAKEHPIKKSKTSKDRSKNP